MCVSPDRKSWHWSGADRARTLPLVWLNFIAACLLARSAYASTHAPDDRLGGCPIVAAPQSSLVMGAAVAAGRCDASRLARLSAQVEALHAEVQVRCARLPSAHDRAAALHSVLHERVLTGDYRAGQFDAAETLAGGEFNCLTASLWLLELAPAARVVARCVERPGHLFCIFQVNEAGPAVAATDGRWQRWEPTCREWREACGAPFARLNDGERTLNAAEVIAKVYYNRSVAVQRGASAIEAQVDRDFEAESRIEDRLARQRGAPVAAWSCALAAVLIDGRCSVAHENLCALVNNAAARRAADGQAPIARAVWALAAAAWPDYQPFLINLSRTAHEGP